MAISDFYCHSWYKQINWQIYPQYWHLVVKMTISFLELQKSPLVSFQGCWTQWQRFESSITHHFWDSLQQFLKAHFCCKSGCLVIPRAPEIPTSKFSGELNTMAKWSRWVPIWQIYPKICQQICPSGTDILCSRWDQSLPIYPLVLTSCGQDEVKFGWSIP